MENEFDKNTMEEQKNSIRRNARISGLNHTKDLISIAYSILCLLFLIVIISSSIYRIIFDGVICWLHKIIVVLNVLDTQTVIFILSLSFIALFANIIKSYFKKD
jgi:hypothetical protein